MYTHAPVLELLLGILKWGAFLLFGLPLTFLFAMGMAAYVRDEVGRKSVVVGLVPVLAVASQVWQDMDTWMGKSAIIAFCLGWLVPLVTPYLPTESDETSEPAEP